MKLYQTVLFTVAVLFGASEGGLFTRRQVEVSQESEAVNATYVLEEPWYVCHMSQVENCINPYLSQYESHLSNLQSARIFIQSRDNLEELASSFQAASTCLHNETLQPHCQNVSEAQQMSREAEFVAEFLASSENIDVVMGLASSVCFYLPQNLGLAEYELSKCAGDFMAALEKHPERNPCDAVAKMSFCFVHEAAALCGDEAVTFMSAVWDHVVNTEAGRAYLQDTPLPSSVVTQCF